MLINGEKWACETCIKGHRATHCNHTDRKLILIKKKGRPSTQCKRCRELRVVRQLHVKCDCDDQSLRNTKKSNNASTTTIPTAQKKKKKLKSLRPLAPKKDPATPPLLPPPPPPSSSSAAVSSCCSKPSSTTTSSISTPPPLYTSTPPLASSSSGGGGGGCCGSNKSNKLSSPPLPRIMEPAPLPIIPPPSSCCGPPSKNQQGQMIRVVTCRCGDDCACIGCDAHPSRAMKEGKNDVYVGFDSTNNMNKRRLSIAAITTSNLVDHPTSILSEGGVVLCGCGCSRTFEDCSNCFRELCQDYY